MIQSLTPSIHPPHGSLLITLLPFFPDQSHCFIFGLQQTFRPPAELTPSAVLRPAVRCSSLHMPIHPPVSQLAPVWLLFWICRRFMLWRLRHSGLLLFVRLHEVSSRHLRRASPWRVASSCVWGCGVVPCLPLHDGTWSMEHPWGHRYFEQIVTGSGTCWVWALGKKERLAMFPALWHLLIFRCLSSQNSRSSPSNERSWIWHLQLVSSARGSAARFMKATAYMLRVANDELHQNDGVLSQALI